MEKLLRPKDYVLLGLALFSDLYFYIAEPLSLTIKKIHGFLPPDYPASNFYGVIKRMYKTKEIKKVVKNGETYLCLTGYGRRSIKRKFPLFFLQKQKWDGLWRIVIFDIKEKNKVLRNLLRKKLKSLGFGMWQRSVYISPFNVAEDIREFLITKGLGSQAFVLVAKRLYAGDEKKLAAKVWRLEEINRVYRELIDEWEWIKERVKKKKHKKKARDCYLRYLQTVIKDPFLPKELLLVDWWGFEVRKYVKEWLKILS